MTHSSNSSSRTNSPCAKAAPQPAVTRPQISANHAVSGGIDFSFNPSILRDRVYQLATCCFVADARDVLLAGPPGVDKSHLAQALGREAIRHHHSVYYRSIFDLVRDLAASKGGTEESRLLARYLKPDLLIIDDMGIKTLPARSGELFL